jgi:nitrogen regulatory protein P-II 1
MKQVTAIIRPALVDAVRTALRGFGVRGLTVSQVFGTDRVTVEIYHGTRVHNDLAPRVRLDILATDADAYDILRVINASASSGLVWIIPVDTVTRVRTGEHGIPAL